MKTTKLVLGIISIVLSCLVMLQSCAAGVSNALEDNNESGGTGGAFLSIMMLAGGIVMVANSKKKSKGAHIASVILFVLAALVGYATAGSYGDLYIWSTLCLILAVVNVVAIIVGSKNDGNGNGKFINNGQPNPYNMQQGQPIQQNPYAQQNQGQPVQNTQQTPNVNNNDTANN